MTITLNGYTINALGSNVYLNDELTGLDIPPIRTSSGNYAGRDGGYVGAQFYSPRDITLQGQVFSSNISTLETTRKAFQEALRSKTISVEIVTNAGASYIIDANLVDFDMPITRELFTAPYKIELVAPDPVIYDNTAGGALTAAVARVVSGGYTYPVTYPVTYAGGTSPTTVINNGSVAVFPILTLTGSMTNPVISNVTANLSIGLNITTGASDVVIFDMKNRTVTLNGSNIFGLLTGASNWWALLEGSNTISLTTASGTDTVTGVLSWRSGVMGI